MSDYDIKKGHFANIEGGKLEALMNEIFGNAKQGADGCLVSAYGALEEARVMAKSENILMAETRMKLVDAATALETIRRWNDFLERATGFNSKERKARLNKK